MPPLPWHRAADFAARQHRHQLRRDGKTPYIAHPFRVALTLATVFECRDPDILAAAVLHDTIEDTATDYEDIEEAFGPWIAEAVATLTDIKSLPDAQRKAEYHARLAKADWRILLIKLADAYDNLSDAAANPDSKFAAKTLRKSGRIADLVLPRAGESPLLAAALDKLESLRAELAAESN